MTQTTLSSEELTSYFDKLKLRNDKFAAEFPGEREARQPIHTVYGGAQIWVSDRAVKLGKAARSVLSQFAPDSQTLFQAIAPHHRYDKDFQDKVYNRIVQKLEREPVEDFRIDFEDGYGNRPDSEEDGHAISAAREVAKGQQEGTLPPFLGIRIKPLNNELMARSIRTLDLFLTELVQACDKKVPKPFFITLPKITDPAQPQVLSKVLNILEDKLEIPRHTFSIELMVETTQSIINPDGVCPLRLLVDLCEGRCTGAHFGTYDYTANCQITADHQDMLHPACDFARSFMQVSLAGTGVFLSDGATNILPVVQHRGDNLTQAQQNENIQAVHDAWKLHFEHNTASLTKAFYQGWDLHPGHLVTRYAANYIFFMSAIDSAGERLTNFISKAAQATLVGDVFDDAATGQGLLNFFLRAINCNALSEAEACAKSSLSVDEIQSRSFLKIIEGRKNTQPH